MKRALVTTLAVAMAFLAGCGTAARSPLEEMRAASARTSALHSLKLNLDATLSGTRPVSGGGN